MKRTPLLRTADMTWPEVEAFVAARETPPGGCNFTQEEWAKFRADVAHYENYRGVLKQMRAMGGSNRAIARALGVSEATIRRTFAAFDAEDGVARQPDQRKQRWRATHDAPRRHCPTCVCGGEDR